MHYEAAVQYLDSIGFLGAKLGLERMKQLMQRLGNPEKKLRFIHVAGTNGKGSTCAMLTAILMEAGKTIGTYTSPHLEEYTERFTINNERISKEEFAFYIEHISKICKEMECAGEGHPTVFEVLTALAFLYFYHKKVELVLLEVGLGGRYDATNIIEDPLLCVITAIGMDHMEYLGDTLEQIAFEKAGIIKEDCPVVLYRQSKKVYETVQAVAEQFHAKLYYASEEAVTVDIQTIQKSVFSIKNGFFEYPKIEIQMLGQYQMANCATVLLACYALQQAGILLTEEQILSGLKKAFWNGRMEVFPGSPLVLLDGAHNVDGIEMLSKSLSAYFHQQDITLLIGILGDKEYKKMVELILPLASKVVITEPHNPRALTVEKLEAIIRGQGKKVVKNRNIKEAFMKAYTMTDADGIVCCCGSLYLIGELRKLLSQNKNGN